MRFDLRRLRAGEWVAAVATAVMAVALFGLHWYGPRSGWDGATHLRWLLVVAIALGLALVVAQALFRAPAIPACLDVLSTVVASAATVWLLYRVAINAPAHERFGAWLELIAAAALAAASLLALREEGTLDSDGPTAVPVVELPPARAA